MPYTNTSGVVYDSGDFAKVTEECLKLADHKGFAARRKESEEERQAARLGPRLFPRGSRDLQRPHGPALRSERPGHDRRRHPFARPGPCHCLCADGGRMAGRAVRQHPLHPGRHQRSADRPRHLRLAQHDGRRQCAEARGRPDHREGEADGGEDAGSLGRRPRVQGRQFQRRRHRQGRSRSPTSRRHSTRRCSCRTMSASASRPPARSRRSRRAIPNGCHTCEVEVDPRHRRGRRWCATPRSTTSAG